MHSKIRSVRAFLLCLPLIVAAAACSTVNLGDTAKLAQAGQASTASLTQFYSQSRSDLPAVLEIEVLRSALQRDVSPPSPQMIANVERVRRSLALRAQMGRELSQLYDSLYELAATDYPAGFRTATASLNGNISAFATAIGEQNPVTDAQLTAFNSLFSLLIRERQRARVRVANRIVLRQLELLQPLLQRDREVVTSLREAMARQTEEGGIALWRTGNVSAKPLLARYGGIAGLEPVNREEVYTFSNPALREAVPALIRFRLRQISAAEAARYEAMETAVAGLIRRHREIEAGSPINLTTLLAMVAELQTLRNDIEAAFQN